MNAIGCLKCKKATIKEQIVLYQELRNKMKQDFRSLNKFIKSQTKQYDSIKNEIKILRVKMARINGILSKSKDDKTANKMLSEISQ